MEEQEAAATVNPVSANTEVAAPVAEEQIPAQETTITVTADVATLTETETPAVAPEESAPVEDQPVAPAAEEVAAEQPIERKERVHKDVTPEMLERTQKDLMKMFDFLGFDDAVVKPSAVNGEIVLAVESADAGRIIGRKGQTLESIQLLLNRMMQKDDLEYPHVVLSIDGYSTNHPVSRHRAEGEEDRRPRRDRNDRRRDRGDRRHDRGERRHDRGDRRHDDGDFGEHDEMLRQQALDAAKEVRHWGDPVTLPEMNAHDRRIIHITLENETDLVAESEGEGARKPIRISIKK